MCQRVFPFRKPTFVDKTFAPDLATAHQIFALADECEVPTQSTSALRSSTVRQELAKLRQSLVSMFITSSGPTFAEYGIHPVELAVSCIGAGILSVLQLGEPEHPQLVLRFSDNRMAAIDFNSQAEIPFAATLVTQEGTTHVEVDAEQLFVNAASSILDFFDAGQPLIDRAETLVIREILDVLASEKTMGEFVALRSTTSRLHHRPPHWQKVADRAGRPVN